MQHQLTTLILTLFIYPVVTGTDALFGLMPVCPVVKTNGTNGFIKSLNFPDNYDNQIDCVTQITVDKGYLVQLIFYAFETEFGSDIVTLYDGDATSKKKIYQ